MFPDSLWYPWYPSACSQPEKPYRKRSACSAFLVRLHSNRLLRGGFGAKGVGLHLVHGQAQLLHDHLLRLL